MSNSVQCPLFDDQYKNLVYIITKEFCIPTPIPVNTSSYNLINTDTLHIPSRSTVSFNLNIQIITKPINAKVFLSGVCYFNSDNELQSLYQGYIHRFVWPTGDGVCVLTLHNEAFIPMKFHLLTLDIFGATGTIGVISKASGKEYVRVHNFNNNIVKNYHPTVPQTKEIINIDAY